MHVLVFINYWIEKCTVKHWNLNRYWILNLCNIGGSSTYRGSLTDITSVVLQFYLPTLWLRCVNFKKMSFRKLNLSPSSGNNGLRSVIFAWSIRWSQYSFLGITAFLMDDYISETPSTNKHSTTIMLQNKHGNHYISCIWETWPSHVSSFFSVEEKEEPVYETSCS